MNPDYLMTSFYTQAGVLLGLALYVSARILYMRKKSSK